MDQLVIDQPAFSANFQRRPFYIQHRLGDHPLFQLTALAALSGRLPKPMVEWNAGHAGAGGNRDQPYREEFLSSAWVLPLSSGQGLHFPQHAPQWVKTDSSVSISFSITFQSRRSKHLAMVHAANAQIRGRQVTR